jgi:uncharacterized phage infection (PIP) family protein YhgE
MLKKYILSTLLVYGLPLFLVADQLDDLITKVNGLQQTVPQQVQTAITQLQSLGDQIDTVADTLPSQKSNLIAFQTQAQDGQAQIADTLAQVKKSQKITPEKISKPLIASLKAQTELLDALQGVLDLGISTLEQAGQNAQKIDSVLAQTVSDLQDTKQFVQHWMAKADTALNMAVTARSIVQESLP